MMLVGSGARLMAPQPIQYAEAIAVAVLGLVVNVVCALILARAHTPSPAGAAQLSKQVTAGHGHGHGHAHGGHHHDLNLKSAYLHVLADAFTSVLAIVALLGGWRYGWSWLDPLMGVVGTVLVAVWAKGLLTDTGKVLLDCEMDHPVVQEIRERLTQTTADIERLTAQLAALPK